MHLARSNTLLSSLAPPALLLLLFLVLPGCEKKASEEPKPPALRPEEAKSVEINLRETKLADIPSNYDNWKKVSFSTDGRQVVYVAWKEGKQFVVVGDKAGRAYDAVWTDTIALSRSGQRIAYSGKREGKWFFVIDGKEIPQSFENTGSIIFSPDGRLISCEAKDKGMWFILFYERNREVYRSQAYRDSFRPPIFGPDGRLAVYELGERGKKRIVFFLDPSAGKIVKKRVYDELGIAGKFSFSSDFSRVVYEAGVGGKLLLVLQDLALDEERAISLPDIMLGTIVLSPNGEKIAYLAAKEGQQFIVVSSWESPLQGIEQGPYEAIASPVFGPDMAVTYQALKQGMWRSVVGDKEGAAKYHAVELPVFTSDGAKRAYAAMKNGRWFMVVSPTGRPDAVKEGRAYDMVVTPVFSPDGRRIAYRARAGTMEKAKRFTVIADAETGKVIKEGPVGDEIWPPVWSADGKAAAYGARQGRELWWRVEAVE